MYISRVTAAYLKTQSLRCSWCSQHLWVSTRAQWLFFSSSHGGLVVFLQWQLYTRGALKREVIGGSKGNVLSRRGIMWVFKGPYWSEVRVKEDWWSSWWQLCFPLCKNVKRQSHVDSGNAEKLRLVISLILTVKNYTALRINSFGANNRDRAVDENLTFILDIIKQN